MLTKEQRERLSTARDADLPSLAKEWGMKRDELRVAWRKVRPVEVKSDPKAEALVEAARINTLRGKTTVIKPEEFFGARTRFGFVSDTHLCSKYERLDVLDALYDIFQREGVGVVYHAGNMVDGECRFNRFDLKAHGVEDQIRYFVEHYPRREGVKTYFITGDDHEGWWIQRESINVGQRIQDVARDAGRDDLIFLGHVEHDIVLKAPKGEARLRIIHAGGGSAYAVSYTSQKYVESLPEGEKPDVVLIGHFHKMEYYRPRGVVCIQGGCTQDQTPFMRKKRIKAELGGWIVELNQAPEGYINRVLLDDLRFYNRELYVRPWEYRW